MKIAVTGAFGYSGRYIAKRLLVRDVVITREEIQGLMEGRLCVDANPPGTTKLTEWLRLHKDTLGRRYTSELAHRIDRSSEYRSN